MLSPFLLCGLSNPQHYKGIPKLLQLDVVSMQVGDLSHLELKAQEKIFTTLCYLACTKCGLLAIGCAIKQEVSCLKIGLTMIV